MVQELDPGTLYSFSLQSCPSAGACSSFTSPLVSVTTPALLVPASTTQLSVIKNVSDNGGQVTLTWNYAGAPSGFRIYRSDDGGKTFGIIGDIDLSTFVTGASAGGKTWTDAVSSDIAHIYKVKAYQTAQYCKAVNGTLIPATAENTTDADWAKFSQPSSQLIIPARPASVSALSGGTTQAQFHWDASTYADSYDFQVFSDGRYLNNIFEQTYTGTEADVLLPSQGTYYYRVKACLGSNCSGYLNGPTTGYYTGYIGPTNLGYTLTLKSGGIVDVHLQWNDAADYIHKTLIYRKLSSDASYPSIANTTLVPSPTGCSLATCKYTSDETDAGVAASGKVYQYKVVFTTMDGANTSPSAETSVDTGAVAIKNWGWASVGQTLGIGWLRTSYDALASMWGTSNQPADSISYNVYMNSDRSLHGYAWTDSYGWLSFDPPDLNGCPLGTCAPTVASDGSVSGWAKFIAADPSQSAWNGWVSLRGIAKDGSAYGLCYGDAKDLNGAGCQENGSATNNKFSGFAWGGDVTGWLGFNNAAANVSGLIITKTKAGQTDVQIDWTNPKDYKSENLFIYNGDPLGVSKDKFNPVLSVAMDPSQGPHSVDVQKLTAGTTYGFYVEGTPLPQ